MSAEKKELSLDERCLLVGPPSRPDGPRQGAREGGCGALVVLKGAQKMQGRYVMSEPPVGLSRWDGWKEDAAREVEVEMGMGGLGCACVKKAVGCLNWYVWRASRSEIP